MNTMNNFMLDIDLGLLFAFCVACFSGLQWLAVLRQNNQNLFKMRLEHYKKFYTLSNNLSVKLEHYKPHDAQMNELEALALDLNNYIDESKFLFNRELYGYEYDFSNKINSILQHLNSPGTIREEDIKELNDLFEGCKNIIEKFLAKI